MEGVFTPALPLLTALQRDGHEILVATAPDLLDRVRAANLPAVVAGPEAPAAAARAVSDPVFAEGSQPWRIGAMLFARVMAPEKLPVLQQISADFEPDLILHPPVDFAAPLVAAQRGIESVTYGTGLLLESELMAAMAQWVAPLWHAADLRPDQHGGMYRHRYLDPVPRTLQPDLGPATACAQPIRPTISGDPDQPLPGWADKLGARPTVYVSLGTVPIFNQPQMFAPILDGLADMDIDVIVTVGRNNDPDALGPQPRNIHVEQWLSLAAVLPHCAAVVCHSGAGTTLAALAHRLPLLLLPRGADQFPTAAACRAANVAEVIAPDQISAYSIRAGLEAVLASDRSPVVRLSTEIGQMPTATAVAKELALEFG
jgi:UDP:flavonoid glycosyltransferase YjiC (YdhE family)